jgi:hypothetical protein
LIPINIGGAERCHLETGSRRQNMIGITLTSEQIRTAPPEVRRWIEREVMASLGQRSRPAEEPHGEHLAVCSDREAEAVLAQIQGVLPVVNVFFELGRQGAIFGQPNIEAFRLLDIAHHTRLPDVTQVVACLDIINQAFSSARGDATARFCALDREGHCFIALETQQNIQRLWHKVITSQQLALEEDTASAPAPAGTSSAASEAAPRPQTFDDKEAAARL